VLRTFTAQRLGDEVVVAWEILEDNFDPQHSAWNIKQGQSFFWTNVQAAAALTGQTRFGPAVPVH